MLGQLKKIIPPGIRPQIKNWSFHFIEMGDRFLHGSKHLIPPTAIQYVGGKDQFITAGNEFFDYFKRLGHLTPDSAVLDIGCGTGRMAYPLVGFLTERGRYFGFDIVPHAIKWCKLRYEHQFKNFHFKLADIYNLDYHPQGKIQPDAYRFEDQDFDFTFATSVFTHMRPKESQNYLNEVARTLKPGGRALLTFFILNDISKALVKAQKAKIDQKHELDGFYTSHLECPEIAIGYDERVLRHMFEKAGLVIDGDIHFGGWSGREKFLSFQDIVVLRKA